MIPVYLEQKLATEVLPTVPPFPVAASVSQGRVFSQYVCSWAQDQILFVIRFLKLGVIVPRSDIAFVLCKILNF